MGSRSATDGGAELISLPPKLPRASGEARRMKTLIAGPALRAVYFSEPAIAC